MIALDAEQVHLKKKSSSSRLDDIFPAVFNDNAITRVFLITRYRDIPESMHIQGFDCTAGGAAPCVKETGCRTAESLYSVTHDYREWRRHDFRS